MRINLKYIWQKLLRLLRSPLSLAVKCSVTFGAAAVFILAIALLLPYIWMGQLVKKDLLDAGRARSLALLDRHFQLKDSGQTLPALDRIGLEADVNDPEIRWIRFTKENEGKLKQLTKQQKEIIDSLTTEEDSFDNIELSKKKDVLYSNYVRIFKAEDSCLSCHNPQGLPSPFSKNEPIGAVIIQQPAEISDTKLFNLVCIIVAGLIGGTGAIIAFYWITQRVILRPIRQLRAIANNVAEGNLDIRSAIKTGDEYEKLANAFNNMLDGLQATQEKLRQANKQLDDKIVELSERNIELFKANKVKGEFLANISHEFRTPLNAILGFAQVLREKPQLLKKEKAQRYAENIIASGNSLLNMINDLLDLAKTQAGKMELHIQKTSVQQLCKALVSSFSLLMKEKKIKIKLLVDSDIPILSTDTGKVQQILYNFLSNAVKFTPPRGRIEIRAQTLDPHPDRQRRGGAVLGAGQGGAGRAGSLPVASRSSSPSKTGRGSSLESRGTGDESSTAEGLGEPRFVRITVSDTGCGIAESDRKKIFEKFRQVDGSITRQSTGTGLGLTISTELAAMLAGNIGMESELGKGSTFWLDIPVTLTKEAQS